MSAIPSRPTLYSNIDHQPVIGNTSVVVNDTPLVQHSAGKTLRNGTILLNDNNPEIETSDTSVPLPATDNRSLFSILSTQTNYGARTVENTSLVEPNNNLPRELTVETLDANGNVSRIKLSQTDVNNTVREVLNNLKRVEAMWDQDNTMSFLNIVAAGAGFTNVRSLCKSKEEILRELPGGEFLIKTMVDRTAKINAKRSTGWVPIPGVNLFVRPVKPLSLEELVERTNTLNAQTTKASTFSLFQTTTTTPQEVLKKLNESEQVLNEQRKKKDLVKIDALKDSIEQQKTKQEITTDDAQQKQVLLAELRRNIERNEIEIVDDIQRPDGDVTLSYTIKSPSLLDTLLETALQPMNLKRVVLQDYVIAFMNQALTELRGFNTDLISANITLDYIINEAPTDFSTLFAQYVAQLIRLQQLGNGTVRQFQISENQRRRERDRLIMRIQKFRWDPSLGTLVDTNYTQVNQYGDGFARLPPSLTPQKRARHQTQPFLQTF